MAFQNIGPPSETIVGGFVSRDDFARQGHQIDFEMMNLDAVIQKTAKDAPTSVEPGGLQTWNALKGEWDRYYQENVADISVLPVLSDADLTVWLDRLATWKAKLAAWALKSKSADLQYLSQALPNSPASTTHQEDLAKPSPFASPWVKLGIVGGAFLGLGWLASSVAKVVRG